MEGVRQIPSQSEGENHFSRLLKRFNDVTENLINTSVKISSKVQMFAPLGEAIKKGNEEIMSNNSEKPVCILANFDDILGRLDTVAAVNERTLKELTELIG